MPDLLSFSLEDELMVKSNTSNFLFVGPGLFICTFDFTKIEKIIQLIH